MAVVNGQLGTAHGEDPPPGVGVYPQGARPVLDARDAEGSQSGIADVPAVQRAGAVRGHVHRAGAADGDALGQDSRGPRHDVGVG